MVKTRHSGGDVDEDLNESLERTAVCSANRAKNDLPRTKDSQMNGYHSNASSGDRHYETRHRRKKVRHRYASSSSHDSEASSVDVQKSSSSLRRRRRSSPIPPVRSLSRRKNEESLIHEDALGVRRSERQRKFMYESFNQSLMGDAASMESTEIDESNIEYVDRNTQEGETGRPKRTHQRSDVAPVPIVEEMDMYTRVKRERRSVKRDMYGIPINEDSKDKSSSSSGTDNDSDENNTNGVDAKSQVKSYNLRVHCPKTNLYEAPPIEPQVSKRERVSEQSTFRNIRKSAASYRSPMRRRRKRAAFHSSDSSSTDSDDEKRFERRKSRSMAMARQRCLPMNLNKDDLTAGILRDRSHVGASMADIEPMVIDKSVMFDSIGGLDKHLRALKEMIVFPLLYPEIFTRFKITPPRGVLFYGPPGTGKTLVARALANECSNSDTKVAFFMRKGADCLSKWVGESERQLRLLFDQAYQMRPSIIFFDEVDGLAPVRSSRQDQIHSSIVSTLLALMDGLDDRGEIVVIGATNRIDSIDPALRRPGRFDREFLFPLPPYEARRQILSIQTKEWNPRPADSFIAEMAQKTVGYCGADMKALCTEAALRALRRRYPQIYDSRDKLQIDVTSVNVSAGDFQCAMKRIVPTAQRSVSSPARPFSVCVKPLLNRTLTNTLKLFERIFPSVLSLIASNSNGGPAPAGECSDDEFFDNDSVAVDLCSSNAYAARQQLIPTHRPRLLLSGRHGQGQSNHLGPALLHHLECLPVHVLDIAALFSVSAKTSEEACTQILREAQRTSPSVVYVPHINDWWHIVNDAVRTTFVTLLNDLDPSVPVLLLATSDIEFKRLPAQAKELFSESADEVVPMHDPNDSERRQFFEDIFLRCTCYPPVFKSSTQKKKLEPLPKAQQPEVRKLSPAELKKLREQEETTLRELRLFLRDVINKLGRDRKFAMFAKPVDVSEVTDYHEIISNPMDLSTMMSKIDLHKYQTVQQFLEDIDLICSNALEYNPDRNPQDRAIRHRACALKDTAFAIIAAELDTDFGKMCDDIYAAREKRGEASLEPPSYYLTKPLGGFGNLSIPGQGDLPQRFSRRARGLGVCEVAAIKNLAESQQSSNVTFATAPSIRMVTKRIRFRRTTAPKSSHLKSPWVKGRRRPMYKKVVVYIDEHGNEVAGPNPTVNQTESNSAAASRVAGKKQKSECGASPKKMNTSTNSAADVDGTGQELSPGDKKRTSRSKTSESDCIESCSPKVTNVSTGKQVEADLCDEDLTVSRTVVVDSARCSDLLSRVVSKTRGFNVDNLLRLHNQLSLCVYQHRNNYDKTALLQDLDLCLQRHVEHHPVSVVHP